MAKKSKFGSMKRFGPRYGRRNKEKAAALEQEYRFKHDCPFCNYKKLKRLSAGIWECEKCGEKFAGKAYATPVKKKVKEVKREEELPDLEAKEPEPDYNAPEEDTSESDGEETEITEEQVDDAEESEESADELAEEQVEESSEDSSEEPEEESNEDNKDIEDIEDSEVKNG